MATAYFVKKGLLKYSFSNLFMYNFWLFKNGRYGQDWNVAAQTLWFANIYQAQQRQAEFGSPFLQEEVQLQIIFLPTDLSFYTIS
jgi:hypothetical protein